MRHREERNPGAELRLLAETRGSPLRFFGDRHALAAQRRRALVSQHRQDPGRRHPSPRWMGRSKNDARSVLSPNGSRKALGDLICGVGRHLCGSCFNGPNPTAGGIFFLELDLLVGRLSSGPCSIGLLRERSGKLPLRGFRNPSSRRHCLSSAEHGTLRAQPPRNQYFSSGSR